MKDNGCMNLRLPQAMRKGGNALVFPPLSFLRKSDYAVMEGTHPGAGDVAGGRSAAFKHAVLRLMSHRRLMFLICTTGSRLRIRYPTLVSG